MIIPALVRLYDRMAESGSAEVAPPGYSLQQVSFKVVLRKNGELVGFEPVFNETRREIKPKRVASGKPAGEPAFKVERRPQRLCVPGSSGSTSNIQPKYLWGNAAYILGLSTKGKPERTLKEFEAFRQFHLSARSQVNAESFDAICKFLENWKPANLLQHPNISDMAKTGNGVFQIVGEKAYVHENPEFNEWWEGQLIASDNQNIMIYPSLVDGRKKIIARIHQPQITTGVPKVPTTGAALVSINIDKLAFESYGKKQAFNAPVGVDEASKYCKALQKLTSDSLHRVMIADTSYIFWSEGTPESDREFCGFFNLALDDAASDKLPIDAARIRGFMQRVCSGLKVEEFGEASTPFYILGLTAQAKARLGVRLWQNSSVADIAKRVEEFQRLFEIANASGKTSSSPSIKQIVRASGRTKKDGLIEDDSVDPALASDLARCILSGNRLPLRLFAQVKERIATEAHVDFARASVLKACLLSQGVEVMDIYLNKNHPNPAYHCGRILAILAIVQECAIGKVGSSIVRRNLSAAMSAPSLILPRLERNAEIAHYPKCEGDIGEFLRDQTKDASTVLRDRIPGVLDTRDQGVFLLGYYHQERWLEAELPVSENQKNRRLAALKHRTQKGEWVRSKNESRLADILCELGIAYVYEPKPLFSCWPDFYVPAGTRKQDVYIEYLGGSKDHENYNRRWETKLQEYERAKITTAGGDEGKLLILDYRNTPFDEIGIRKQLRSLTFRDATDETESQ